MGAYWTGARKLRRSESAMCAGTARMHTTLLVRWSAGFVLLGHGSGDLYPHMTDQYLSLKR